MIKEIFKIKLKTPLSEMQINTTYEFMAMEWDTTVKDVRELLPPITEDWVIIVQSTDMLNIDSLTLFPNTHSMYIAHHWFVVDYNTEYKGGSLQAVKDLMQESELEYEIIKRIEI